MIGCKRHGRYLEWTACHVSNIQKTLWICILQTNHQTEQFPTLSELFLTEGRKFGF